MSDDGRLSRGRRAVNDAACPRGDDGRHREETRVETAAERGSAHDTDRDLFQALVDAAGRKGAGTVALVDGDGRELTYGELLKGAFALGRALSRRTAPRERVGILLPTSAGAVVAFYALIAYGRVPAMLNFTAGREALSSACRMAEVRTVLTAHRFLEQANLDRLAEEVETFATLVRLEDVRKRLGPLDKVAAVVGPRLPAAFGRRMEPDEPAVILFTSGTEGEPKGVALSHRNILANVSQVDRHLPILPDDVFFNPMPVFHSYGLSSGTILPLTLGHKVVLHPSPLHVKQIPERVAATKASIMLATDTFLRQYIRAGEPGSMDTLRFVVCGAERVRPETREAAESRFGFKVLEGYGVTEAAPVVACNHPDDIRDGTVGRPLPEIETRLVPVEGLHEGRKLLISGPNVMLGYMSVDRPGEIVPPPDGWHDTGDVVVIDDEGFVAIRGRLKRFAKIGGERVSLTVSEAAAFALWPDHMHAAATIPDPNRGEAIVLVTDNPDADRAQLLTFAQKRGTAEIAVPRHILVVDHVPVLGTGKVDLAAVSRLARKRLDRDRAGAPPPETLDARAAEDAVAAADAERRAAG